MFRNKSLTWLVLMLGCIDLISLLGAWQFGNQVFWFVVIIVVLFNVVTMMFTIWRYRAIKQLSAYLRNISSGNYKLDVRDNNEGELSILKNEIYKVTTILAEHGALLEADKAHLTNAISDISHQLKTPLTSMMVMTDLLKEPNLPTAKRQEFTNHIQIQIDRLSWLVTSLLKLSKIDAGTVQFKKEPVNVRELIDRATESMMVPMDIKEQTVTISGEDDVKMLGDFEWLQEALINIIKNNIEHTKEKGTLHISYSQNVLYTEITIQDEGEGISKKDLPYIFQRFYKGEKASDDSVGIGLAMAQAIVTKQNGDVTVESEVGIGTAFHLIFYHTPGTAS